MRLLQGWIPGKILKFKYLKQHYIIYNYLPGGHGGITGHAQDAVRSPAQTQIRELLQQHGAGSEAESADRVYQQLSAAIGDLLSGNQFSTTTNTNNQ